MITVVKASSPFGKELLTYWRIGRSQADRAKGKEGDTAMFTCDHGHQGFLLEHEIAEDGTVTPSVVCEPHVSDGPCTFHDFIRLEGWETSA